MIKNIIEAIQKSLPFGPVEKVSPNSQQTEYVVEEKLGQAAIPAVLTAIYKFTRTEDNCKKIIVGTDREDWLSIIFHENENIAVENVARYAGTKLESTEVQMENVAHEAIRLLKDLAGTSPEKVKAFMSTQRHIILVHLPAELNMGDLLHDEHLDDRTNKMEGPVSNFIHKIENTLSGGGQR
jgi:hypothetical protein